MSTAVLGFIKTPMFRGETNQPQFLSPLIHVDTVGEAIADVLYKAEARTIWYPGLSSVLASLVSCATSPLPRLKFMVTNERYTCNSEAGRSGLWRRSVMDHRRSMSTLWVGRRSIREPESCRRLRLVRLERASCTELDMWTGMDPMSLCVV